MEETHADEGRSRRGRIGAFLAPLVGLVVALAPLGLEPRAHRVAVIFAVVVVLWVSEVVPIAVTSLLIPPALVVTGVATADDAFAGFGDPLLFLFLGGFFLANAMHRHGLDARIARLLVGNRFVRGRPARVRVAFLVATFLLTMWISNTATTVIMIPLVLGAIDDAGGASMGRAFTASTLVSVGFAASIGGMGTLVGSPPNGITARFLERAGVEFGFVEWLAVGLPSAVLLAVAMHVVGLRRYRDEDRAIELESSRPHAEAPMTRGAILTLAAFGLAIVLFVVPDLAKSFELPHGEALARAFPSSVAAVVAACPLFFLRDETGERVLPWEQAVRIEWGLIILYAGGIALGEQMFETGLAEAMSRALLDVSSVDSLWGLTALLLVFSIFFSETCSNVACVNMVMPLAIAAADALHVSPVPPALAVGLGASSGFMLPTANAPNAIAYGTGRIPLATMLRAGFELDVIAAVVIFAVLRTLCPLLGYG